MTDQRIAELIRLRRKLDAELARLAVIAGKSKPARRSRHVIPECGTESAYQRHRYYGEERDDACKQAHREHERVRANLAKATALAARLNNAGRDAA